jgi:V8-like Glu-specific endopeptidase
MFDHHSRLTLVLLAVLTVLLAPSCSSNAPGNEPIQRAESPLIYGTDDRIEYAAITDPAVRQWADATALISNDSIVQCSGSTCNILSGVVAGPPCPGTIYTQPAAGDCTAFLIGPDVIATAGHCANPSFYLLDGTNVTGDPARAKLRIVFGWVNDAQGHAPTSVPASNVYQVTSLVSLIQSNSDDSGVMRLDRPVTGRVPLRTRHAGVVPSGAHLMLIGYPMGIPLKVVTQGSVTDKTFDAFFKSDVDATSGNSGSPVINKDTGRVEGILTAGPGIQEFVDAVAPDGTICQRENQTNMVGQETVGRIVRAMPWCHDGVQNVDETGVDCGGSCEPCELSYCHDGIRDGDETGVDCGGSCDACMGGNQVVAYLASRTGIARINIRDPNQTTYFTYTSCSGAVINNRWVLTDQGCFSDQAIADPTHMISVDLLSYAPSGVAPQNDALISAHVIPDLVLKHSTGTAPDVALVRLSQPVEINQTGTQWFRSLRSGDKASLLGQSLAFYGYGGDGVTTVNRPVDPPFDSVYNVSILRTVTGIAPVANVGVYQPDPRLFETFANIGNQLPLNGTAFVNRPEVRYDRGGPVLLANEVAGIHTQSWAPTITCASLYGGCGASGQPACDYGPICGRDPVAGRFVGAWDFRDWVYQTIAQYDSSARNWGWALVLSNGLLLSGQDSSGQSNQATRLATGRYRVTFPGLDNTWWYEQKGSPQAVAFGGNQRCSVSAYGDNGPTTVSVDCASPDGTAADASFVVAFQKATFATGAPLGAYLQITNPPSSMAVGSQWNSTGQPNSVVSYGPGAYEVTFTGMGTAPRTGSIQITALTDAAHPGAFCNNSPFYPVGNDMVGDIRCYDPTGAMSDVGLLISYGILSNAGGSSGGYATTFTNTDSGNAPFQYSYLGGTPITDPITVGHPGVGSYWVNYPHLDASRAIPLVTANNYAARYCNIANWAASSDGTRVYISCYDRTGAPSDTRYATTLATSQ